MELKGNQDLFQTVFDAAANGIGVLQPIYNDKGNVEDFSILLLNKFILNWIGEMDYKGKRYKEVFPTYKETGMLEKFIVAAETGINASFEHDGMDHWFRYTSVRQDELLVITIENITERKQAEMALKESLDQAEKQERLYDSITNNTPDLVYVFDLSYRFTYANKALLTMWGKSEEDAIGRGLRENGYEEWHAKMHEREIDAIIASKESIRGTVSFPHAELGSRVYDYILVPVFNEKGDVEAIAGTTRDITDIKRAEEKLQLSEAKLKSMIDQTPAPTLVLMGDDLVIEQVNKSMLNMLGRGEEIIGIPLIILMPELQGQYIWEQVQKVYKEGIPFAQSEVCVSHKRTGVIQDHYYNIAYRPLKEEGQITGMIQVAIDVTEQVVARKKLEESENHFRALINASSDVVYSLNADWTVMRPLDGRGFLLDATAPIEGWMEINVHALDLDIVKKTIATSIANKSIFELEHRVVRVDGSMGWTFSRAIPILDVQGEIIEWFGVASDVTERKKAEHALKNSEEDLRNLVLQSPIGICVLDADTLISEIVNDKFVEIAGKPYEAIMGKWYWDTFAEAAVHYQAALQEVVDTGKSFYINEVELMLMRHGKEEVMYVTFVYEPMKDSRGSVKKVVVWVLDNTFQVQTRRKIEESESRYRILSETLEQQIKDRTKELQRSNEDLQQFAHVASHDLKEPVRKIKTFTNRLEEQLNGTLDESATRFIEKIHVAAERMSTMIDGVLAYSTINAAKQKTESVDLNELLKNIEIDLEIPLLKTSGTIQYRNLPTLEGAPVLLYQLFYNLIKNSIKFANDGIPPKITVSSETYVEQKNSIVCITVEDNGIGFDPNHSSLIFETFTRLNSKDKYEGTGLGLALCKKIVERHGGAIVGNSGKDKGATFNITLPLQQKTTGI